MFPLRTHAKAFLAAAAVLTILSAPAQAADLQDPTEFLDDMVDQDAIQGTMAETIGTVEATLQDPASATAPVAAAVEEVHQELQTKLKGMLGDVQHTADDTMAQVPRLLLEPRGAATEEGPEAEAAQAEEAPQVPTAILVAAGVMAAAATAGSMFVMFWTAGSTAGTAGGAAATKGGASGLKKVAPVFSPLFTRFEGRTVLAHPNRSQLYTLVAANPGVRLQDLCTETGLSRTAVTHHLRLLEQQHLIVSQRNGRSRHYYENGGRYERAKKDAYAVLQNDRSKDIARFILENPGTIQKTVCEALDVRPSIAHWHVSRLAEAALIEPVRQGRTVSYYPAAPLGSLGL